MPINWKTGDKALFSPKNVVGAKGFDLKGVLIPIADLPNWISVKVDSVAGKTAQISILGGVKNGATATAEVKDLHPIP